MPQEPGRLQQRSGSSRYLVWWLLFTCSSIWHHPRNSQYFDEKRVLKNSQTDHPGHMPTSRLTARKGTLRIFHLIEDLPRKRPWIAYLSADELEPIVGCARPFSKQLAAWRIFACSWANSEFILSWYVHWSRCNCASTTGENQLKRWFHPQIYH